MYTNIPLLVKGHCKIIDDLGNVLLDKNNAIHPQNMARIIARALANESNCSIKRMAFGNGGTQTDVAYNITYNPPNDGQPPDNQGWTSRLYNEIYSEIIDEGNTSLNPLLGTDPGSSSSTGTRPGGGSNPSNDPISTPHVSGPGVRSSELGLVSQVKITCVLNASEPLGQIPSDIVSPSEYTESSFSFDEIGLFSDGAPAYATSGSHDINVGNRISTDNSTLLGNTLYSFRVSVDGGTPQLIQFTTPATGTGTLGAITYGDLCDAINNGSTAWNISWNGSCPLPLASQVQITNTSSTYTSLSNTQTYGFVRFISGSTPGTTSSIVITPGTVGLDLIASLNAPTGGILMSPVQGVAAGAQNDPVNPNNERERLLTHLVFSPVLKAANRTLTVTYTLNIAIARSV